MTNVVWSLVKMEERVMIWMIIIYVFVQKALREINVNSIFLKNPTVISITINVLLKTFDKKYKVSEKIHKHTDTSMEQSTFDMDTHKNLEDIFF